MSYSPMFRHFGRFQWEVRGALLRQAGEAVEVVDAGGAPGHSFRSKDKSSRCVLGARSGVGGTSRATPRRGHPATLSFTNIRFSSAIDSSKGRGAPNPAILPASLASARRPLGGA